MEQEDGKQPLLRFTHAHGEDLETRLPPALLFIPKKSVRLFSRVGCEQHLN